MENSARTICIYSVFFLVCILYNSSLQITPLISDYLDLWPVLIMEVLSSLDIKKVQFQFLVTFLAVFVFFLFCFFSGLYIITYFEHR